MKQSDIHSDAQDAHDETVGEVHEARESREGVQLGETPSEVAEHERELFRVYRADSPEGAPFTPAMEGSFLVVLMVVAIASVTVAGIVVGILFGWGIGLVIFGFGLCLSVGGNPEVWASILRAREHKRLERESREMESKEGADRSVGRQSAR